MHGTVQLRCSTQNVGVNFVEGQVESVELRNRLVTESYFGGTPVLGAPDAPEGCVWDLGYDEALDVAHYGGEVLLFADDLYRLRVLPAALDDETIAEIDSVIRSPFEAPQHRNDGSVLSLDDMVRLAILDIFEEGQL
jgi:hypothetical protein